MNSPQGRAEFRLESLFMIVKNVPESLPNINTKVNLNHVPVPRIVSFIALCVYFVHQTLLGIKI